MKPVAFVAVESAVQLGFVAVASAGLLLADVTVPDGAINGGIVGAVVVVGGAVMNWYLIWRKDRRENRTQGVEVDQKAADRQAARQRKADRDAWVEMQEVITEMKATRDLDRQELHGLRDRLQSEITERAISDTRLSECEKDRAELFRRIEALEKRE